MSNKKKKKSELAFIDAGSKILLIEVIKDHVKKVRIRLVDKSLCD